MNIWKLLHWYAIGRHLARGDVAGAARNEEFYLGRKAMRKAIYGGRRRSNWRNKPWL